MPKSAAFSVSGRRSKREVNEMGEYCIVMLDPEGNEFFIQ
jgi:hypothetical protein